MQFAQQIYGLILLSIMVASIAWTITQEELFREWRDGCKAKSESSQNIVVRKFFYVFTCEYCFSHWVSILIIMVTGFSLLIEDWRGYLIAFFVLPWLANQWMSIYRRLRIEIKKESAIAEKLNEETES